jgi:DNA-binding transcriptional ArsR family regulator
MSEASERLARYLTDVEGADPDGVDDRLAELDDLQATVDERVAADRPVLAALSNDTRYGLVRALVESDEELCVCELRPLFDVSESAVSYALGELAEAGLVESREDGRWRHYEATERAERLLAALDATRSDQ